MTDAELRALHDEMDADDIMLELEDDEPDLDDVDLVDDDGNEDPEASASPAVVMGLGPDKVFRHTAEQLRDPIWCRSTQADRAKATSFAIVNQ